MMKRIGFFFGAGAELSYGLPSGGQFALDIFRRDPQPNKETLREMVANVPPSSIYTSWLPSSTNRVSAFGRNDYTALIEGAYEANRGRILDKIDNFDAVVAEVLRRHSVNGVEVNTIFKAKAGKNIGDVTYDGQVKFHNVLHWTTELFKSDYFSAALELLKASPRHPKLSKAVLAILQLLIGCHGRNLDDILNSGLFAQAPSDVPVFDELTGLFHLQLGNTGQLAFELLLDESFDVAIGASTPPEDALAFLVRGVIESIYAESVDYQGLIDTHFRYLYSPNKDWAKFCKIFVFLHSVRDYIVDRAAGVIPTLTSASGYYHDIMRASGFDIPVAGTANYNNLFESVFSGSATVPPMYHLNGGVNDWYDPYANKIHSYSDKDAAIASGRLLVPFLFTQSGVKPLTSVEMSRRYVELYDTYQNNCDAVAVVGFGFNNDDGHINCIFREILASKKVVILVYTLDPNGFNDLSERRRFKKMLRIEDDRNLILMPVDNNRKTSGGMAWGDSLPTLI